MPHKQKKTDRIFDGLSQRFAKKIYTDGNLKGAIRLHILHRDLCEYLPQNYQALRVLDAGGGMGNMAIWLAQQGHHVTLLEPSLDMLTQAQIKLDEHPAELARRITLINATIQEFVSDHHNYHPEAPSSFDWITCHAVLEWLAEPQNTLQQLVSLLETGGKLSLMFFNQYSKELRHLQGGDLKAILEQRLAGDGKKSLAPISPLKPTDVQNWLNDMQLELLSWSGIRCFYDYAHPEVRKHMDKTDVLKLESHYSRQDPWRQITRYQHMLCYKPEISTGHKPKPA